MAIEIKELHIKINVDGEGSTPSKKKQTGGDKQAVIEASVEQVMTLIDKQKER